MLEKFEELREKAGFTLGDNSLSEVESNGTGCVDRWANQRCKSVQLMPNCTQSSSSQREPSSKEGRSTGIFGSTGAEPNTEGDAARLRTASSLKVP